MKVSLKTAFSILDGRLSTEIGDVYKMLNYIFNANLFTHQLPTAMRKLDDVNPKWLLEARELLGGIKSEAGTDDFESLMSFIDANHSGVEIELRQINERIGFAEGLIPKQSNQ